MGHPAPDHGGHNVDQLLCAEGEHDWIKTIDAIDDRPRHRRGWPRIRPAPLVCNPRTGCGYRLQSALSAGQEVSL